MLCTLKVKNFARGEMNGCMAPEGCHGDTEILSPADCQESPYVDLEVILHSNAVAPDVKNFYLDASSCNH
ncbi:hypothetical protein CEXT_3101 [Caerostris extrusa]|uniref:Uncharacterized protein n=1 Tax=Caerostris extrusa TaxID=172846 RepID=A0AAV4WJ89_CAEEX|nr:hypothetical protein CEXT_3101 [Caerostris extrusa]